MVSFSPEEANANPPVKMTCNIHGDSNVSRCESHLKYNGCYKCHLLSNDHRPDKDEV